MDWKCKRCRQSIGQLILGKVIIIHGGREIITDGYVEQKCHRCGTHNDLNDLKEAASAKATRGT